MTPKTWRLVGAAVGALLTFGMAGAAQAQETVRYPTFKVFGRIYLDQVWQEVDRETGLDFNDQDSRIRTARIGAEGQFSKRWSYKGEASKATGGEAQWEDLLIEYRATDALAITAGNFKTVSLENISSSRYTTFLEKGPFTDVLDIGRVMNIRARYAGSNWTVSAAVSADSINTSDPLQAFEGDNDVVAASARATYAPVDTPATKIHLGAWARTREQQGGGAFVYRTRNNTNFGDRYVSSGAVGEADRMVGLEGLVIHRSLSLQGEWATTQVDRLDGAEQDFDVYYLAGSWYLTGEMRSLNVKKGELGRTKVLKPLGGGGFGAVELAVRYDRADLSGLTGTGDYSAWTAGLNWHPVDNVRLMANYSRSRNENPAPGADVDVETAQVRLQYDF
jgi:phosphate-selective porin OprO/OprP